MMNLRLSYIRRILLVGCFISTLVAAPRMLAAQVELEYKVKAAFVLNFLRFSDLGKESDRVIVCLIDGGGSEAPFRALENERMGAKPIYVKVLKRPYEIDSCQIVFVSRHAGDAWSKVLKSSEGRPILTVGEIDGFTEGGGLVNFFAENNRFRFEVNVNAVERSGLVLSSKLLRLARIVRY